MSVTSTNQNGESGVDSPNTHIALNLTFKNTLERLRYAICLQLIQIFISGIGGLLAIGSFISFSFSNFKDNASLLLSSIFVSLISFSSLLWYLIRLNKALGNLRHKQFVIGTFSEIQQTLIGKNDIELNFEYRASVKKMLDTLNELLHKNY